MTDQKLTVEQAVKLTGMTPQRVSALKAQLADVERYRKHLLGAEYVAAHLAVPPPRGTLGTGENEWSTPEVYIELARKVLGEFDLDPATNEEAQKLIRAAKFYTAETDGLTKEWHGRVWLNPPYAPPLMEQFISKMVAEYAAKRVTAGIMLTHNYTDTAWFHEAANAATVFCFTRGRIKFIDPHGNRASPTQGQTFFYFGKSAKRFAKVFSETGLIVSRYD